MRSRLALTLVFSLPAFTVGCRSPIAPTPPAQIQSAGPSSPPPRTTPQTAAVLAIERASVEEYPPAPFRGFQYGYGVRFLLRETGGTVGAQIEGVTVVSDTDSDETGPSCWVANLRVPPGGTLDLFYSDDGLKWLGYCAPAIASPTALASVRVIVNYQGEDNPKATVEAVIPVRPRN